MIRNSWRKRMLLGTLLLFSEYAASQALVLQPTARVSRDAVRLSDFLPVEAPAAMRRAAEQVELGQTPRCHSVRVFEMTAIEDRISSTPKLQGLTVLGPASVERVCFPIPRDAVLQVISEFVRYEDLGAGLADSPLVWSESIYASRENPGLEIVEAHPDPVRPVLQIHLRCVDHSVCPSFLVGISSPQPARIHSTPAHMVESPKGRALANPGQRMILTFENATMRVQLPVTCLQRGGLGETVRAMDPTRHRVFRAEVTGPGTLVGNL